MRNKKIVAYLCMGLLLLVTAGCGNSDADSDVSRVDTINFNDVNDTNMEESNTHQNNNENVNNQQDSEEKNQNSLQDNQEYDNNNQQDSKEESNSNQSQTDSELDGSVESIGDNSIVINKTFHISESEELVYVGSDKVLVTVYFSEETKYEVWTVKNGGINGDSDIDKREGDFSDIKNQVSVNLTGTYEGNDFYAKQVIIYNFI